MNVGHLFMLLIVELGEGGGEGEVSEVMYSFAMSEGFLTTT